MVEGITTRSPGFRFRTFLPTSSTTPTPSCPRIVPGFMPGTVPRMKCRSVPQVALAVSRTIASVGSLTFGSLTVSRRTSPMPWKTIAFMGPPGIFPTCDAMAAGARRTARSPCETAAMDRDTEQLQRMGYAQQLLRDMGGFANFALSFSIISVLTGAVTLYGHGLKFGGPIQMFVGWPLVTLFTLTIAASLAELASSFPTAGALYHWSALLGGRGAGFFTAWLNTIGQFAITAGIDYGLAEFLAAMLGWTGRPRTLALCAVILMSHAALNHLGVRLVARLNDLSAWVHIAGVAILVGALAIFAPHQPAEFLLTHNT